MPLMVFMLALLPDKGKGKSLQWQPVKWSTPGQEPRALRFNKFPLIVKVRTHVAAESSRCNGWSRLWS